ncbi:MAG TPA: hypothetical protein PK156_45080 [Polyangium sp.]|nr:hypothetical protein [Polyangium sp.]
MERLEFASPLEWPLKEFVDELRDLTVIELADVYQFVKRTRAARGDRASPELVSHVVAFLEQLRQTYPERVPISVIRAGLADVPRVLLNQALFEAESQGMLRIEPVEESAPFIEVSAGIPHERGLLYWIVPYNH